jgi:hypothetical protein
MTILEPVTNSLMFKNSDKTCQNKMYVFFFTVVLFLNHIQIKRPVRRIIDCKKRRSHVRRALRCPQGVVHTTPSSASNWISFLLLQFLHPLLNAMIASQVHFYRELTSISPTFLLCGRWLPILMETYRESTSLLPRFQGLS